MRMFHHVVLNTSFGEVLGESACNGHGPPPGQRHLKLSDCPHRLKDGKERLNELRNYGCTNQCHQRIKHYIPDRLVPFRNYPFLHQPAHRSTHLSALVELL
jgi:hypothetical protein